MMFPPPEITEPPPVESLESASQQQGSGEPLDSVWEDNPLIDLDDGTA